MGGLNEVAKFGGCHCEITQHFIAMKHSQAVRFCVKLCAFILRFVPNFILSAELGDAKLGVAKLNSDS